MFSLAFSPATVSATRGSTVTFKATVTPEPGFDNKVDVWVGARPTGVDATIAKGSGLSSTITLTIAKTAKPGSYPLTIGGSTNTGFGKTATGTLVIR